VSDQPVRMNEESEVSIPLKNLISILAAVAVAVTGYFQVTNRISALENKSVIMLEEIEENDTWIDEFQPPKEVQDTVKRVRELELQVHLLQSLLDR
jgi:hypothetical protein